MSAKAPELGAPFLVDQEQSSENEKHDEGRSEDAEPEKD
jgi:hypothetical protein